MTKEELEKELERVRAIAQEIIDRFDRVNKYVEPSSMSLWSIAHSMADDAKRILNK